MFRYFLCSLTLLLLYVQDFYRSTGGILFCLEMQDKIHWVFCDIRQYLALCNSIKQTGHFLKKGVLVHVSSVIKLIKLLCLQVFLRRKIEICFYIYLLKQVCLLQVVLPEQQQGPCCTKYCMGITNVSVLPYRIYNASATQ